MTRPADLTELANLADIDRANDGFLLHDVSAGLLKRLDAVHVLRLLDPLHYAFTGNSTLITGTHNYSRVSNRGATGTVTLTLWTAVTDDRIQVVREAPYALRVKPASGETIGDAAADKYIELVAQGALWLRSSANGVWRIEIDGVLYTVEL